MGRPAVDRYEAVDPWLIMFANERFDAEHRAGRPLTPTAAIRQIAKEAREAEKLNSYLRERGGIDRLSDSERVRVIEALGQFARYLEVLAGANERFANANNNRRKSTSMPELRSFGVSERAIVTRLLRRLETTVTRVKTRRGMKIARYAPQLEALALSRALDKRRGRKKLVNTG